MLRAAGTEPQENRQEVRHHLLPAGTFGEQAEQEAGDLPHPRHHRVPEEAIREGHGRRENDAREGRQRQAAQPVVQEVP